MSWCQYLCSVHSKPCHRPHFTVGGSWNKSLRLQPLQRCYCENSGSLASACVMRRHYSELCSFSNLSVTHLCHNSFSNTSVALPTSQPILQPFRRLTTSQLILQHFRYFTYVTKLILQPFCRFFYVTSSSLNSPGEPPISHRATGSVRKALDILPHSFFFCLGTDLPSGKLLYLAG